MTALTEERRAKFRKDAAELKLDAGSAKGDGPARIGGLVLMIGGAVAAFVVYFASLTQADLRNIASYQILATALLIVAILGAALYVAGAIARVLRLWLLRQLYESQAHTEQIAAALETRR
ncbi:hypothetical protein [Rhodococcus ruber]|uniref:hypothetical protein n=1 Tax=Rhodococcus ruber TaxID=1830 RepID=UPI00265E2783|nr:hypothetical protein [Rhodococcus ruber]MDO1479145.1 hypothetical protein [Rhodococcus ruber]